jgi:hypothetical protein
VGGREVWLATTDGSTTGPPDITQDQLEYELEFARDGDHPSPGTFHFHLRCFGAWELERTKPVK